MILAALAALVFLVVVVHTGLAVVVAVGLLTTLVGADIDRRSAKISSAIVSAAAALLPRSQRRNHADEWDDYVRSVGDQGLAPILAALWITVRTATVLAVATRIDASARADRRSRRFRRRLLTEDSLEHIVDGALLRFSNLRLVLWPRAGFTKGEMIAFYAAIAPALLPHLRDRPLTFKRFPFGVGSQFFYEKQCPSYRPPWVDTAPISGGRTIINFCLPNDLQTLLWAANLADVELHTSLAAAAAIEHPTTMVFDLDPGGPQADIVDCCQVSVWLRELLDLHGLESFAKTSGSNGLQVYVPLNTPGVTYADTKPFAKVVAELAEQQHPELVVSQLSRKLRPGKVLVDWSQNDEHKTSVNVYSLRAKDRPGVSTPVLWSEVDACLAARDCSLLRFGPAQVVDRVERDGDLFEPVLTLQQRLPVPDRVQSVS